MTIWRDKVVLITGGSAGLGFAVARQFALCRAKVCLVARDEARLQLAQQSLEQEKLSASIYPGDVLQDEDVDKTLAQIVFDHGQLDVLVNNVGKSTRGVISEATVEQFAELMSLNFYTMVRCTRAAVPHLMKTQGHVVNIGSLVSKTAWPFMATYSASKHAVAAYTHQLRIEGPKEIHFMLVCPGPIRRDDAGIRNIDQAANLSDSAKRHGADAKLNALCPQKIARKIVSGCEKRTPELVMPARAKQLFALAQLSARWGDWLIRRKISD
jgi:short-subunit dehydrogenase